MERINFSAYTTARLAQYLQLQRQIMQMHLLTYAQEPCSRSYKRFAIQRDHVEEVAEAYAQRTPIAYIKSALLCLN